MMQNSVLFEILKRKKPGNSRYNVEADRFADLITDTKEKKVTYNKICKLLDKSIDDELKWSKKYKKSVDRAIDAFSESPNINVNGYKLDSIEGMSQKASNL